MPVLAQKLAIFPLKVLYSDPLVFLPLCKVTEVYVQIFKTFALLKLQLLCEILVERILFLEQCKLLPHFLEFDPICSAAFFNLPEELCVLGELGL